MIKKDNVKGFIAGVCTTAAIAGTLTAIGASSDVMDFISANIGIGGRKIYWDGIEQKLTDENGKEVFALSYNDSTYLPVRAMSKLLGKEIEWDSATKSIYVGGKPVAATTQFEELQNVKNSGSVEIVTGEYAKFKLKNKEIQCLNMAKSRRGNFGIYVLDGKYSKLIGNAIMPYTVVGSDGAGVLSFYRVPDIGEPELIERYELKQGEEPKEIEVDLTGVINLKIEFNDYDEYKNSDDVVLYDAALLAY